MSEPKPIPHLHLHFSLTTALNIFLHQLFHQTPQTQPVYLNCPLVVHDCIIRPILDLPVKLTSSNLASRTLLSQLLRRQHFPEMPSQKQTPTRNKHGCLPPRGCTLPSDSRLPQVATGHEGKGSYEAAFLVKSKEYDLYEILAATVGVLATLKAWFAYKLRTRAIKDGFLEQNALLDLPMRMPDWQTVWNLLQEKGPVWTEQYHKRGPRANPWEVEPSLSALDLFAHVLIVLTLHIDTNMELDSEGTRCHGFKWHQYYYEDEGKYFCSTTSCHT